MALTVETALQAGQLAQAIQTLQELIAQLEGAIAAGYTINSIVTQVQDSTGAVRQLQANLPLNVQDSATLFNNVLSLYNTALASLNQQLAAIN